ncbi:MAG: hypothetical protein WBG08_11310 [Litorimonas sp.]
MDAFLSAWHALPLGSFEGAYQGRRYGVTRTMRDGGRQGWIWAEERGGPDRISGNLYLLSSGPRLKPCEMAEDKVMDFVIGVEPIADGAKA